ncbi:MAG: hypothetical protein IT363_11205 [Methanoregulaceae archaeon]|nr:hypothetical protein [Methanoregulaceae archaeon]
MATTNYHTVNGEIIGETTSSVRTGYLTDGLGSVTATQGSTGNVLATYRYKPYGTLLAKTGTGPDPRFLWVGAFGSLAAATTFAENYNRARQFSTRTGLWGSMDPLWPAELAYGYVSGNPTSFIDPDGTAQVATTQCDPVAIYNFDRLSKCKRINTLPPQYAELLDKDLPGANVTSCNPVKKGSVWTCNVFSWVCVGGCAGPGVEAHEAKHRADWQTCCAKLCACLNDPAHYAQADCVLAMETWQTKGAAYRECRAHRVSLAIFSTAFKKECNSAAKRRTKCCKDLAFFEAYSRKAVSKCCEVAKKQGFPETGPGPSCDAKKIRGGQVGGQE